LKLGIRGKLFAISLALIGLMALVSGVLVETVMRELLVTRAGDELMRLSAACVTAVEVAPGTLSVGSHQALAKALGKATRGRVTLIERAGRVLADSAL
jgi:hypothetical protein